MHTVLWYAGQAVILNAVIQDYKPHIKTILKVYPLSSMSFGLNHITGILHSPWNHIPDFCLLDFALLWYYCFIFCSHGFCLSFSSVSILPLKALPGTSLKQKTHLVHFPSIPLPFFQINLLDSQLSERELANKLWTWSFRNVRAGMMFIARYPYIELMG